MYKIGKINKISKEGLETFSDRYEVTDSLDNINGLILRSKDIHDLEFPKSLLAIARAGAGVNNIPVERLTNEGVVVFNAPGANANAVKELTIAALIMTARNIPDAIFWSDSLKGDVSAQVEKGKSQFKGQEVKGNTLGVVGLGAIGCLVANTAHDLGMNVIGTDPYLTVDNAVSLKPGIKVVPDMDSLLAKCDFVTIHIPALPSTKECFNADVFDKMKKGSILLNFSRDSLVNEDDLLEALKEGQIAHYATDFPGLKLPGNDNITIFPHIGASTKQAEDKCASMATEELMDYIENGNITNSVNLPNVTLGPLKGDGGNRIAIITKGEPDPIRLARAMFADKNIIDQAGGVRGEWGYALLSTTSMIGSVPQVPEVIKTRIIAPL